MTKLDYLAEKLRTSFDFCEVILDRGQITLTVPAKQILSVCDKLKNQTEFQFEMLMDLCGIDYLHYGCSEWETTDATSKGFERGVRAIAEIHQNSQWKKPRLAVVYHLLSIKQNHRLRVKSFVADEEPFIDSVVNIWNCANWFEREAFDLYGILFSGHPDLRRILTDYGFIGHPFRKDFPLVGNVEVRYDAKQGRVIYEPVDIVPRTLVPKVIRETTKKEEVPHG